MTKYRTTLLLSGGKQAPLQNSVEGKYGAVCIYLNDEVAVAVGRHPNYNDNWVGLIASRGMWGRYDTSGFVDQISVELRDGIVYATVPNLGTIQIEEIES